MRRRNIGLILFGTAVSAAMLAAVLLWLCWLPGYLGRRLLPEIAARYGLRLEVSARKLTPFGVDFSDLALIGEGGRRLRIDSIRLDCRPSLPFGRTPLLRLKRLTVSGLTVRIVEQDGRWRIDGMDWTELLRRSAAASPAGASGASKSPLFQIDSVEVRHLLLELAVGGRRLVVPAEAAVTRSEDRIRGTLRLELREQPLQVAIEYLPADGTWTAVADGRLQLDRFADFSVPAGAVDFHSTVRRTGGQITLNGEFRWSPAWPQLRLEGPIVLTPELCWRGAGTETRLTGSGRIAVPAFHTGANGRWSMAEPLRFSLDCRNAPRDWSELHYSIVSGPVRWQAPGFDAEFASPRIEATRRQLALKTAAVVRLPGQAPLTVDGIHCVLNETRPELRVDAIRSGERLLGSARAALAVKAQGAELDGGIDVAPFAGMRVELGGRISVLDGGEAELLLNLPLWHTPEPLMVRLPGGGTLQASGAVGAGAALKLHNGKVVSGGSLMLRECRLLAPELDFSLENLSADVGFQNLTALQTPPGQRLSFDRMKFGKLNLANGRISAQLEAARELTLESLLVDWCGGEVSMQNLHLAAGRRTLHTRIDCDRVRLADALGELGIVRCTGDGTLSGRIPVTVRNDGIYFDTGYLYSIPGESGSIRLLDDSSVLRSAAAGAAAVSELDLACEALKDFHYQWARLQFSTTRDNLNVKLQFDGKPNLELPFRLDNASSRLVRDPRGKARFQGLQLNFNVSLPLNRLLKINERLKNLSSRKEGTSQ